MSVKSKGGNVSSSAAIECIGVGVAGVTCVTLTCVYRCERSRVLIQELPPPFCMFVSGSRWLKHETFEIKLLLCVRAFLCLPANFCSILIVCEGILLFAGVFILPTIAAHSDLPALFSTYVLSIRPV